MRVVLIVLSDMKVAACDSQDWIFLADWTESNHIRKLNRPGSHSYQEYNHDDLQAILSMRNANTFSSMNVFLIILFTKHDLH